MYEAFYGLGSDPFRLLPDPGICFPHRSSSQAWAYLIYGLKRGEGIVVVTGPPGSGKSTLAERLLGELNPAKAVSVSLVGSDLSATDLLRKLAYALGLPVEGRDRAMLTLLIERHLIDIQHTGRRVLVVIDEAQGLSHNALEAMRLLTDIQSQSHPVLQLVLFGQEELEGVMSVPGMEQFQQRVIASCRLRPMDLKETKAYLEYRLNAAGWQGNPSINGPAVKAIFDYSQGVPRHVNKIGSRLLLHGSSEGRRALTNRDVVTVVGDLRNELLAPVPVTARLQPTASTIDASVYELALVPSAPPPRPENRSAKPALAARAAPATPRHPVAHALKTASARAGRTRQMRRRIRRGISAVLRASLAKCRRDIVPGARAGLTRLRRGSIDVRRRRSRLWAVLSGVCQGAASKVRTLYGRLDRSLGVYQKRLDEALRSRGWDLPGGAVTGVVSVALLVGVAGVIGAVAHDAERPRSGDTPVEAGIAQLLASDPSAVSAVHVLDNGMSYLGSELAAGLSGGKELDLLLEDDLLTPKAGRARTIRALVGPGVTLSSWSGPTRDEGGLIEHDSNSQPLVSRVGLETTSRLVSAAAKSDSSLGLWALATAPDVVSDEGVSVWNPRANSGLLTAHGISLMTRKKAPTDAAEPEPVEPPKPTDRTVAEAVPTSLSQTDDAAAAWSATVADEMVEGAADGTGVQVAQSGSIDFARILPATASGHVDEQPLVQALELVEAADAEASAETVETIARLDRQTPVEEPRSAADDAAAREAEVTRLLAHADAAIKADRLLLPVARSAHTYLKQVFAVDPDNVAADKRMDMIVARYAALAKRALAKPDYDQADLFVNRGLRIKSSDARMRTLRATVADAREAARANALAEAEMARVAAELEALPEPGAPPPPPPPPPEEPSSYQRWMGLFDGL